jgi:hypothetical protein
MGVLLQFLSVIAFTAWGLYLWARVTEYGSQPACNDRIKYVVFFATVKATEPWLRWLWVVILVLSAVALMVVFAVKAWGLFVGKLVEEEERVEEANLIAQRLTPTEATGTQPYAEAEGKKLEQPWYIYMSLLRLLCVAPPLSLIAHSRTTAQSRDLRHCHAGAHSEYPALSYPVTLTLH